MSISITKRNYLWQSALLTLLVGVIGGYTYYLYFPHHYFGGYPLIPIFFFIFGLFTISMTEMCRKYSPRYLLQIYMLLRVMRMLFSIIVMAVYCIIVREESKEFILTFIANYLIYLTYDSWFYFRFELNRKNRKMKHETNA